MKKTPLLIITMILLMTASICTQGQSMKVPPTVKLKVKDATSLKIGDNFTVATGAKVSVYGDVTVGGAAVCTDATAITIYSTSAADNGSFIFQTGEPNATIQRYITNSTWHQVSIPVSSGATTEDFSFSGTPRAWLTRWNTTTGTWDYVTELTETLNLGEGFDLYIEGTEDKVVDFAGPLTPFDLTFNTTSSTVPLVYAGDGFNLVGNPYSSAIDFDDDGVNNWTLTNMEQTVWVLDQTGGPAYYRARPIQAGTGALTDGIIPMGQAFFVKANAASPVLTIPAARRLHNSQAYYKSTGSSNYNIDSYFIMNVYKNNTKDEIWVTFGENGTKEFDNGFDASKMFGDDASPQLFINETLVDNELSINHIPNIVDGNKCIVDVGFVAGENGEQLFTANNEGLIDEVEVELEDILTGEFHNLIENPTYTFTASKQDDPDRFRLHFYSPTGIEEDDIESDENIQMYAHNKTLYIKNKGILQQGITQVSIYDIMGREIFNTDVVNAKTISIPLAVNQGYYVVKAVVQTQVKVTKIYIK